MSQGAAVKHLASQQPMKSCVSWPHACLYVCVVNEAREPVCDQSCMEFTDTVEPVLKDCPWPYKCGHTNAVSLNTGVLWWQVQLHWNVRLSARNFQSLKTVFTVVEIVSYINVYGSTKNTCLYTYCFHHFHWSVTMSSIYCSSWSVYSDFWIL